MKVEQIFKQLPNFEPDKKWQKQLFAQFNKLDDQQNKWLWLWSISLNIFILLLLLFSTNNLSTDNKLPYTKEVLLYDNKQVKEVIAIDLLTGGKTIYKIENKNDSKTYLKLKPGYYLAISTYQGQTIADEFLVSSY